jgi:hypothetical protein
MEVGEHTIAAVDATGESYSIHFKVKDIKDRQEK